MKNAFEELEFYKVKALIKVGCTSSLGEKLIDQLHPLKNKSEIEKSLSELYDSVEFINQKNSFNLNGLTDTESLFPQLKREEHYPYGQCPISFQGQRGRLVQCSRKNMSGYRNKE